MIKRILTYYAERLEESLSRLHRQPEGLATVGLIGSAGEECPNKVVISLVNLEKETSGDMTYMQRSGSGFVGKGAPLMMNMHVMLAAVYDGKRYGESLSVLSETLAFIRSTPKFQVDDTSIRWKSCRCPPWISTISGRPWAGSTIRR